MVEGGERLIEVEAEVVHDLPQEAATNVIHRVDRHTRSTRDHKLHCINIGLQTATLEQRQGITRYHLVLRLQLHEYGSLDLDLKDLRHLRSRLPFPVSASSYHSATLSHLQSRE